MEGYNYCETTLWKVTIKFEGRCEGDYCCTIFKGRLLFLFYLFIQYLGALISESLL